MNAKNRQRGRDQYFSRVSARQAPVDVIRIAVEQRNKYSGRWPQRALQKRNSFNAVLHELTLIIKTTRVIIEGHAGIAVQVRNLSPILAVGRVSMPMVLRAAGGGSSRSDCGGVVRGAEAMSMLKGL